MLSLAATLSLGLPSKLIWSDELDKAIMVPDDDPRTPGGQLRNDTADPDIVCVAVSPYDKMACVSPCETNWDDFCEATNNLGKPCGAGPDKSKHCLSKTCKCDTTDEIKPEEHQHTRTCSTYVVSDKARAEDPRSMTWLTDEWCKDYCDNPDGCPQKVTDLCMCGPEEEKSSEQEEATDGDSEPADAEQQVKEGAADDDGMLVCPGGTYVAASEASTDLWCMNTCGDTGCTKDAQEVCRCDDDGHAAAYESEGPAKEGEMQEAGYGEVGCLSISAEKTNEYCNHVCKARGTDEGCPKGAKDDCKCGDDAVTDEVLAQAMEATRIRDTQRNEARAAKDSKAACVARGRPHEDCGSEER